MSAELLDGKAIAAELKTQLRTRIRNMAKTPGLAVILVGEAPASVIYVNNKVKACADLGIKSQVLRLPEGASAGEVDAAIMAAGANPDIHGILVQLPLPAHLPADKLLERIPPEKDVDGLHPYNLGRLMGTDPCMIPCTPQAVMHLLAHTGRDLTGLHAMVIGRSRLFGKPMGQLLLAADCTVTTCHSKTRDLPDICRTADILIAATGQPEMVKGDWIKPGAIVIDVGITRTEYGLKGDVEFASAAKVASFITPVPGGVGPMTIAWLLGNTVQAAS